MDILEDHDIYCPKCEKTMKKIIISRPAGPITIDHCNICDGYWFDGLELEKIITDKESRDSFFLDPSEVHEAHFHCPRCSSMVETKLLFDVRVDKCVECEGIWLDKGELTDIQKRYRTSMNENVILDVIYDLLNDMEVQI